MFSFIRSLYFTKKMLLDVAGYWQLLGKLKVCIMEVGVQSHQQTENTGRDWNWPAKVLEAPTIRVTMDFSELEEIRNLPAQPGGVVTSSAETPQGLCTYHLPWGYFHC